MSAIIDSLPSESTTDGGSDGVFVARAACPACESNRASTLFRAGFLDRKVRSFIERKFSHPESVLRLLAGADYELRRCEECTLIYQRNILSDAYTSALYDDWLLEDDAEPELSQETMPLHQHVYYANELMTIGRLLGRPHHQLKILDYGLGRGWWCRIAQALGFDAYGTDLADGLVSEARRKGINAIEFKQLGLHRFDFINTEQVFEHLSRPLAVLKDLKALLKPGGIVKISVPEGRGLERRIPLMDWNAPRDDRRFLQPATPLIHINTFTRRSIAAMGERCGFSVLPVPIRYHYSLLDGRDLKSIAKALLRPLYRRATAATYVFLRAREA
jgi:2-polyprenyl-3-methyl-5-hydroxy-6-metoxy-1,4-benzoquinol methylase